ncbi:1-Acyl dihydroxyacetone phosphate reductase [Scheffersomyces stipitis CBS 6054]|uniref:1-Acyl dihydroxyacetone phosphate reductase n=1 Tax=Scheffersomyces stipitis (strain ATCC 58785 / CBS 6054 / NBRC 10063 / NRRL Y-11545) TaxID=322104 RepID=A3LPI1_PICST|nr:1-Acyl dihydroxyacetone phosphate reductase [Scheffersomyces stipitis CBS 6054]ABN65050.2 1-Acyl dihydroxyacetone phosphate reductase [Scheffersomyces stipitis CBS 6054]
MSAVTPQRQKIALVTGASSGIGYVTCLEFAKRGYKVFAGARRLEPMEPLREHGVIPFSLDVSSLESVKKVKQFIIEQTGDHYLDILFNNAGQLCTLPAIDVTDEWFTQCFEVNVFGPMRLTRELSPLLINAKGAIGFTGSFTGVVPIPFASTYCASKAAIHQYAATLRIEMKPFGVKVLNFVTGGVDTGISDERSFPATSLFNTPDMDAAMKERKEMARKNQTMDPKEYARQVVNDFEAAVVGGKLHLYRGSMATFFGFYCMALIPRVFVESLLIRRFKLANVYSYLEAKYSKTKLE